MNEPKSFRAIMLSSTFTDLKEHRQKAIEVISKLGYLPMVMEHTGAGADADVIESSLNMVRDSAAYVGMIGFKYGQIPRSLDLNPDRVSLAELEFNEAMRLNRPILLFIMGDRHPVTKRDVELDPAKLRKLDAFRKRAKLMADRSEVERIYETFDSLEQFSTAFMTAMGRLAQYLESSRISPVVNEDASELLSDSATRIRGEGSESESKEAVDETLPMSNSQAEPAVDNQITNKKHATAPFYSDHAARRDFLNRKAVAETVATMIENVWQEDAKEENIDRTFMVHLHGRWGSGKTSILNFLKDSLLSQNSTRPLNVGGDVERSGGPSWIVVDYNAWRNQSLGPAWWTLMETVYRQARDQLGGWSSFGAIRLILWDRWWRIRSSYAPYAMAAALAIILGLLLIWIWRAYLFGDGKPWFNDGLKIIASVIGLIVAVFAFGHSYPIGSARTAKSYLELSRDPLSPLIERYGKLVTDIGRPVAVFVDDLDRCNAHFVVELLQTIQTLFRHAKVLYVVAADRDWVCASYQQQYKDFNESIGEPGRSLGHLFVEKVFQLSVEVPRLSESERDQYWDGLINSRLPSEVKISKEIADELATEFERAETEAEISAIVERYRNDPERADFAAAKGFQRMQAAPLLKEREHFLSDYVKLIEPNPRAMKRLLNAYGFRRGFDIQSRRKSDPDALVRWTILENRWPILADYLEGRSSGNEMTSALMEDKAVREVARDMTWEQLRPVASAPDQPPAPEITPGVGTKA